MMMRYELQMLCLKFSNRLALLSLKKARLVSLTMINTFPRNK